MTGVDDAATPKGAAEQPKEAQPEKSERETMLEQIEADQEQQQQHLEPQHAQQPEQDPEPKVATNDNELQLVDDPKRFRVRVKVGDRDEERSLDEVINELQTHHGRVRSMTQREKDLLAELAEKDQKLEAQLAAQQQLAEATSEEAEAAFDARVSEVMDAIVDGDTEKGAELLKNLIREGRQQEATPVDESQIVGKVKAELNQEQKEQERKSVWEQFVEKRPEFQDQVDESTGETTLSEQRQYGDFVYGRDFAPKVQAGELSYREALEKTAEAVDRMFTKPTEDPNPDPEPEPTPEPSEMEKRKQRKQQLDQLPVAAGARAAGETEAEAETVNETVNDIIAQRRAAHGLPA